jgi:hypothetical protein
MSARKVRIETQTVGNNFGCCAILRDAKTGRKLAETDTFPRGCEQNARTAARDIAATKGFEVEPLTDWTATTNAHRRRKMLTITVSDATRAKLDELAKVHGSISAAVEALAAKA